jgi:uncharacterized protein (TIGR03000 family)
MLSVQVPGTARVYVNNAPTRSTGAVRRYVSRGLQPGREYAYTVRVELDRDGQTVSEEKTVNLQAGQSSSLSFGFEAPTELAAQPQRTELVLQVPADAKVYLAGQETATQGTVRQFTTTRLAAGQEWADYTVRVEVQRQGRTLAQERVIALKGGQSRELRFDFEAPALARFTTQEAGL